MHADLKIDIPSTFVEEREYIVRILLDDCLGFSLEINIRGMMDTYVIRIPGGKEIVVQDSFFSKVNSTDQYLSERFIPSEPSYFGSKLKGFESTPLLYGFPDIEYYDNQIICRADLFASAFFMLTRWEEYVKKDRDEHNRFPGDKSLAYRNNFLGRPVVNEYASILKHLLRQGGLQKESVKRRFSIIPTHDVDHFLYWTKEKRSKILKELFSELFRRNDPDVALKKIKSFLSVMVSEENDPFLSFEYFMDKAERAGVKAVFYFYIEGNSVYDPVSNYKTQLFKKVISIISGRGHNIAIHPSYESFLNPSLIKTQKDKLENISGRGITESRQHYLRLSVPYSWRDMESCNIINDSTLYYSGFPGFRSGTCYRYKVFDFLERRVTEVVEQPLLIMDTCLKKKDPEKSAEIIQRIRDEVHRYNGDFVFNWHNSNTGWAISGELSECLSKGFYGE